MRNACLRASTLAPLLLASPVFAAEDVSPTDEIIVTDERRGALADAEAFVAARPGNVSLTPIEAYRDRYAVTFRDTLAFSPGVVMQPNFGEDGRMSIRGSGLAQNIHLRGVELVFNGVPINAADGFGDYQELDPLFASHVTVMRGANAFGVGGATLGGAIDIAGATAQTVDERFLLRAEGGSFGTSRLHGRAAADLGAVDILAAGAWQRQDGFRDHAQQRNQRFYANMGLRPASGVETRIGVLVNDIDQEMSGALSLDDALNNPRRADPGAIVGDFQRDLESQRVFTTTRFDVAGGEFVIGGSYANKNLYHPVPVTIYQSTDDYTSFARYSGEGAVAGVPVAVTMGMRWRRTDVDSDVFLNFAGTDGPQITDARLLSSAFEVYGEARATLLPGFTAVAGAGWLRSARDYDDHFNDAEDARIVFRGASPRFGLLWQAHSDWLFFANASASYEPPTFLDLTQAGVAGFVPLAAQEGFTYEAGMRGGAGPLAVEVAFFRASIENEFVAYTVEPLIPAPVFNAGDTIHQGVELLARLALVEDWNGLSVTPRIAYAWNDFHFDGDPIYGDNRLAGMARHVGRAEIVFASGDFRLAPQITFQAGENFVDYANTLRSPDYALIGLEASAAIGAQATIFVEARNLADRGYALNYSTLADARTAASLNVFTPGEGRAVFAGLRIGFGGAP